MIPQLFKQGHTILGTVVVCAFLLQPVLGYLHHRYYVNHESRGLVSYAHIWFGRVMMLLGVINGGLGLQLSSSSNTFIITYSVVAAVMFLFYVFIKVLKRNQASRHGNKEFGGRRASATDESS